mgnify:CR=1 FL=1
MLTNNGLSVISYNIAPPVTYNPEFMRHLLFSLLIVLSLPLLAEDKPEERDVLFQDDEIVRAVLTAPIAQAYAQRDQDVRIWIPGQFTYADENGEVQRLDVSIRTRGLFRREYCDLPPLQLNFRKKQVKGTLLDGQDKLKIVAPCQHGALSQQWVVLEYLAYRTLQILTDISFSTRLIRLSYVDSDEKREPWTDLVFVIEDDDDMADRLDLVKITVVENRFDQLDHATTALAELFQLLIANNDYSVLQGAEGEPCCHNSEMLALKENVDVRIPVPFDFDFSGLVNTRYAAPPSHVPIRFVRTRFYRGLCQPPAVLEDAIEHVQSKRQEIYDLFENSKVLESKRKEKTLRFIDDYFAILDDPERLREEVYEQCRGTEELEEMLSRD